MARRLKTLRIATDLLVQFLKAGSPRSIVAKDPLPDDAQIVRVSREGPNVVLLIESESFPEIDPYRAVPELEPPTLERAD